MWSPNQKKSIKAHSHRRLSCLFNFLNIWTCNYLKAFWMMSIFFIAWCYLHLSTSVNHTLGKKGKFEMHVKALFRNLRLYFEFIKIQCFFSCNLDFIKTSAWGFPGGSLGKESSYQCMGWRHTSSIPESGRSPARGNGNPLQYSCLEDSMDRGDWRATVQRVTKSRTRLKWLGMPTHNTSV